MSHSLRKQPTFRDATAGFPAKWLLRNERRNSIQMTRHYPDLGSASDWAEANFPRGTTNQKHYPDLCSAASSVWNFCARFSAVISGGNQWWRCEMKAVFFRLHEPRRTRFFTPLLKYVKPKCIATPPPPTLLVGSLVHCRVASSSVYRLHRFIHLGEERLWSKVFVGERMWPQKIPINGSKFEVWC